MSDEKAVDVLELTTRLVQDGQLSNDDVVLILKTARERQDQKVLTVDEINDIIRQAKAGNRAARFEKTPLPLCILSLFMIFSAVLTVISAVIAILALARSGFEADTLADLTTSTLVVAVLDVLCSFVASVLDGVVGLRLLRGMRANAGALIWTAVAFAGVSVVCEVMLYGASSSVLFSLVPIVLSVVLASYLNPTYQQEILLARGLRDIDTEAHAKRGTLGLADDGKGFIRLDFFNVFWTFVVCSFLGLVVELIWHMVVVEPGVYEDRAGLLYGPFSPIYGFGAVLMTVALNRFRDRNPLLIFAVCTVIGGTFEYLVSWFMEIAFGAKAWDYMDQFMGPLFDGRTCLLFASMFGVLGLLWIKILLPGLLRLINMIPWRLRAGVTTVCATLMLLNCIMTVLALDNWYARVSGHVPSTPIEQFYAQNFPDEAMQDRFQSMTITPENSARS